MSDAAFMPGFRSLDTQVEDYQLPVEGSIPEWLSGSLVRNGPGKFDAGDQRLTHWFDGLAMLRKYDFDGGGVRYTNRFLRTEAYADAQAGKATGQFGTDERGLRKILGWLRRLGPPEPTDNANVHVARIGGEHVALTEVPRWVRFDPDSLDSHGDFAFEDDLDLDMTTAHLSEDPHTGDLFGFGLTFGRTHEYHVYRIPRGERRRERLASIPTDEPAYIHDCAVTADHVVLVETPLRIAILRALSPFTEGFFDMLDWRPETGTRVLLVDRDTGDVRAVEAPNAFTFHAVNAYEDGPETVVDLVDFEDDAIVDALTLETLEAEGFPGVPAGRLARYRIDPDGDDGTGAGSDGSAGGAVTRERLYDGGMELPTVPRAVRAREHRYAYGQATDREGANGLVKVDTETGSAREWWERGVYVEEPRVVRHPDAGDPVDGDGSADEDRGVVLAPALDVDAERSMLLVFDARTLEELARARLPHHHPFGFHGRFFPD
ncbi:MAG: carotenoid oxygenase family protein [Haloarculaceae archaeon]